MARGRHADVIRLDGPDTKLHHARSIWGGLAVGAAALLLSGCAIIPKSNAPSVPISTPTPAVTGATAALTGVTIGPDVTALGMSRADANGALSGFVESCPVMLRRDDQSGLFDYDDWFRVCRIASEWPTQDGSEFFAAHFETARVGEGSAFATGYFEPQIAGSRTRRAATDVPVYAMPDDLVRAWPAGTPQSERTGNAPLGRYGADGNFELYPDRAAIEAGALEGRVPIIAYASDPVEFFFLQIQGSGRLITPDGEVIRIGYAGQNGRGYTGIGGVMRERGLLGDGPGQYAGSMQGIMAYIRENPRDGADLMRLNKSWIFFRELTGDGPLGAMGVPVRRGSSVAADPAFVPLGAPVWLEMDRGEADGLWIAQDTGGAIKGANRFDTFWGAGADAREIAGGMSARGDALLLLPKGSVARLNSDPQE